MASLQTLRNRGGVIVAVVIGIALLAFVLGDLLTSGSTIFGSTQMNVGQINGKKITAQEYSAEINYLTEIQQISSGDQSSTEEQNEMIKNQAWESMITKYAFDPAMEQIGLRVTQEELTTLLAGDNVSPVVAQLFSNPQTGGFDKNMLLQFIDNMEQDQTGRLAIFWKYLQAEVSNQALLTKFNNLVTKGAYVTAFEAENLSAINSNNYSVRFVADRYESIADSTVKVTKAQAKEFYTMNPSMFYRANTTRAIEYVSFDAVPTEEDYAQAAKYIEQLASDFATTPNIEQFATLNSQSPFDTRYYSEGVLSGDLGSFAFTATTDQVFGPVLEGDEYTLARISAVKVLPDSVNFSHIVVEPTQIQKADSIATMLRGGANFANMATEYSLDTQSAAKGGLIGSVDPQTMASVFSEPLLKSKAGDIIVVNSGSAIHIIKVNKVIGEGKKVQLATIKYTIEPSEQTRNESFSAANKFAANATSPEKFSSAIAEGSLIKRVASVGSNDRQINGIKNSRSLAQWAYTGKRGDVSQVYEFGDSFIVATITSISEKGITPFEEAADKAENLMRRQIKGQILADKMGKATSIDQLASELNLTPIADSAVNFQSFMAPEVGYDPAFAGGVTGIKGNLSKPIVGRIGVYVAEVTGKTQQIVDPLMEKNRLQAEAEQNAFTSAYQELMELSKIKDERYKFY